MILLVVSVSGCFDKSLDVMVDEAPATYTVGINESFNVGRTAICYSGKINGAVTFVYNCYTKRNHTFYINYAKPEFKDSEYLVKIISVGEDSVTVDVSK